MGCTPPSKTKDDQLDSQQKVGSKSTKCSASPSKPDMKERLAERSMKKKMMK